MKDNFVIKDEDFFHKQDQLYIWLRYIGFATWRKVHDVCINLIESDSNEIKEWYGNYPIYKLFYPLIYAGIVEVAYKNGEKKCGFTLAKKIALFPKSNFNYSYSYRGHFLALEEPVDKQELYKKALYILNTIPTLENQILKWEKDNTIFGGDDFYIRERNFQLTKDKKYIQTSSIVKKSNLIFEPDYLAIRRIGKPIELYKIDIDKDVDAINMARCYIKALNNEPIFEYIKSTKVLSCIFPIDYSIIPTVIYRLLIMLDIDQLKQDYTFTYLRSGKPFSNISEVAIKLIVKYFGNNSVKYKE